MIEASENIKTLAKDTERLEKLKTEDPEKYQKIIERREKMQELRRLRKEDPEAFKKYLQEHPYLHRRPNQYRHGNRYR